MTHVSGLQAAQLGLVQLLEGWREQFSAPEFAVLLDLLVRRRERARAASRPALVARRDAPGASRPFGLPFSAST
jgi:hypothetical protein